MPKITDLDFFKTLVNPPVVIFTTAYPQYALDGFEVNALDYLVKIMFADVLFIEALQNYVIIHTTTKKYISYLTFKSVEEYLPVDAFIKVHKSFIIAANRVDSIDGNEIHIGQHHIPISRNLKEEVMEKLLNGKFLKR